LPSIDTCLRKASWKKPFFRQLTSYSERRSKHDLGLLPLDYTPPEVVRRPEVVCWNQRKEDRERKALDRSKGEGKGKGKGKSRAKG